MEFINTFKFQEYNINCNGCKHFLQKFPDIYTDNSTTLIKITLHLGYKLQENARGGLGNTAILLTTDSVTSEIKHLKK
jgi:hypothetical protein